MIFTNVNIDWIMNMTRYLINSLVYWLVYCGLGLLFTDMEFPVAYLLIGFPGWVLAMWVASLTVIKEKEE